MRRDERRSRPLAKALRKRMTKAEVVLWVNLRSLRPIGARFRRQHPIGPYVADFAHLPTKLVIEVDGATHSTPEEMAHDERRTMYLRARGWHVLRFYNLHIYEDVSTVVEEILRHVPLPSRAANAA